MRTKIGVTLAFVAGLVGFFIAAALAQNLPVPPTVSSIGSTDTVPIVPRGVPSAQQQYALPKQITSQMGYQIFSPTTGWTYTFGNSDSMIVLTAAATSASGTIVLAAAPSDGDQNCIYSKSAVTALVISAPGTTLNDAVTTIGALAQNCYIYQLSTNTWNRSK